ncbi:MAG TPA: hypothetical protein VKV15_26880 [Bryobacteraceae bacterium]|nr:hypothetical protein [Bryobacteraceae bacterium]
MATGYGQTACGPPWIDLTNYFSSGVDYRWIFLDLRVFAGDHYFGYGGDFSGMASGVSRI